MLTSIQWKQIAGYPEIAFCSIHDRPIDPIILRDAEGTTTWGCPYCAEQTLPVIDAQSIIQEKLPDVRHLPAHYLPSQVTYWCPVRTCNYHTISKLALETHVKVMHTDADKMKCCEGMCDKDAYDFCAQCESAICKDHMDWKNMCPPCGANHMWAY